MTTSSETAAAPTRELAAIMFSDIAGYTLIMGRDEHKGVQAIADHRDHLRALLPRFNGRIIGEVGDGTLSSFHSAVDAVSCARELQSTLSDSSELRLRIGIHVGDVLFADNTILGDGVNVASRIHALAPPGGICISARVYDEIRNKPEFQVSDLGEQKLKNVERPIRVYALGAISQAPLISPTTRRALFAGAGAMIAAAVIYSLAIWRPLARLHSGAVSAIRSIAVLPLQNLSGNSAEEYFSDGITDELTTDLAQIAPLRVTSRTSAMQFKGATMPLPDIANKLNVDAIVEGSVVRAGDRVRITAQLIEARTDRHVWANNFEKNSGDVLAIQDELAREIADAIRLKLTAEQETRLTQPRRVDAAAYDDYLRGRFFWNARTEQSLIKAQSYFEGAIAKDPSFARAYSGLADTYMYRGYIWGRMPPRDAMPLAKAAAQKALQLEDAAAEGHASLALVELFYDWDFARAEEEFKRAIALNPNYASAHHFYAIDLAALDRHDESIAEAHKAVEADPLSVPVNNILGEMLIDARHYDDAIEQYRKTLEMDPNNPLLHGNLYRAYRAKGMDDEAFEELMKQVSEFGLAPQQVEGLRKLYPALGWSGIFDAFRQAQLADWDKTRWHLDAFGVAANYAALGDHDRAFAWFDRAYELRSGMLIWPFFIEHDPWEEALRADPRFAAFQRKMIGLHLQQ